jgi:long-chain acyl-CoA synthetase
MRQPIATIGELFLQVAARHTDCILQKKGGRYEAISSDELAELVRALAATLVAMGVDRGDRVGLIASNGLHWPAVDFATLSIGAVLVPMDATFPPHQLAYILGDSRCKVLFVEGTATLETILALRHTLPALERLVLIGGEAAADGVTTLAAEASRHRGVGDEVFAARLRSVRAEDLATIVYTSGTTSHPKGVMISHRNLTFVIQGAVQVMHLEPDWTALSALSLCYLFERVQDYCYFYAGCTIAYAESVLTVATNAQEVRPHVFITVPRILEKIAARIEDLAAASSPAKRRTFSWANAVGQETIPYRTRARPLPPGLRLKLALADRLVLRRLREIFGGRLQYCMSGGAPLPPRVARLLWGAGVAVFEGYGLTETSPTVSVNREGAVKLGTVGRPFPGVEVRISEQGEILARGPNIMMGYTAAPEEASKVVDSEGWIHTGDLGHFDSEGFLTLTGRMKHVIMNSYGDKIVPEPIEHALKESRLIQEAVIVGEGRPFYSALLVPEFEALGAWGASRGMQGSPAELVRHPAVRELYGREVEAMNERSGYDPIDGFALLDQPFTVQGGEITVTQKVRRQAVQEKYRDLIAALYRDQEAAVELRRRRRH